ncbi:MULTISPECIES: type I restriction-modification system subunit S [Nostocales]|jgi:type I restriction enzyme S subunit|uniref:methylation-associated defense system restriction endonuclease subunit S MAD5 n=1 Tax=Nostocales TaxID=1161 RepID=UPI00029B6A42|nr:MULTISPECIES: type I restriction-modification system subunit S [Nostocales]MBO1054473.1 restriction endonuclease subunit S [Dolichospermum sp. DET73]AFW95697.1 type I restriction-modification system S subunit [Anabaena sp. 90]MTJ16679.1 restriction endonuclease subunit S [Dolichospermum sp. UHCC 0299]MTJ21335.1 restriction endonuclease subunit S [Dolichospermum sp. UHCC 0352]MTJ39299.1 restriction endonuclease subunit S [Dolichospermum sp. UHCC 0406]
MKTTKLDFPVMSSWMESNGRRLDCNPYLSGAFEAKVILEKLSAKKQPLHEVTKGGLNGIFHAGRERRQYVDDPAYGVPFLGSTDILAADLSSLSLLSKKQVAANPNFAIQEGWTLITRSGTIGRMVYVRSDMAGMACTEHAMRVVPDVDKILPGYLYAYLSSKFGVPLIISGTYGSIIQSIEPHHIADLPVPRLGADIEETVDELIKEASIKRAKALNILYESDKILENKIQLPRLPDLHEISKPLVAGVSSSSLRMRFDGAFHSPLALEAEKAITKAKCDILTLAHSSVNQNLFKPNIFKRQWVESENYGPAFVSGNDIYRMSPSPERFVSKKSKDIETYLLKKGWIVFQAAGQLNGIFGWPILVNSHLDGMFCADDVFRLVPHNEADAGYIYAYLRSNYGQRLLKRQAYGYSIPRVVSEHVEQVIIPWPDEKTRQSIGQPVFNAWEDLAKAIQIEAQAVKIVESSIDKGGA